MDESNFSKSNMPSTSQELEKKSPLSVDGSHMPPAPVQGQSTQFQPKLGQERSRERLWTTVLFVTIASLPALLVGCTLAFPSIALLDLSELEERPDFRLSTLLSDVFGVRTKIIFTMVHVSMQLGVKIMIFVRSIRSSWEWGYYIRGVAGGGGGSGGSSTPLCHLP